jgi:hypothetical protein
VQSPLPCSQTITTDPFSRLPAFNMALNWAMLNPNRIPVPLPHEMTVTTIDSGVEISLMIPDAPPTASSNAGGSGGIKRLKANGKLYLTDQRVRFTVSLHR